MKWKDISKIDEIVLPILKSVSELRKKQHVLPYSSEVFRAFELTPHDEVRVVILGQDPYPTAKPKHANGLAFSVGRGINPFPPSLANIFQELVSDTGCPYPTHGNLTKWAKQGVLLLNTSLTVEAGKPGSHGDLWHPLIKSVIESLPNRIWVLWGRHAQSFQNHINEPRLVLQSPHPSPLSAHRGFFGSAPFSTINMMLGGPKIDWSIS
jgi:uracil-DNA glycosylase